MKANIKDEFDLLIDYRLKPTHIMRTRAKKPLLCLAMPQDLNGFYLDS